jgi:hypothetical protein
LDDYELLEKLNQLTKQKYVEMDNVTKGLITRMEQINEKCKWTWMEGAKAGITLTTTGSRHTKVPTFLT